MAGDSLHSGSTKSTSMASPKASKTSRPEELEALKAEFGEKCRIIDDVGDFKHVVTVKRNSNDLAYKFQIEGKLENNVNHSCYVRYFNLFVR